MVHLLSEIVEQDTSATDARFGILLHLAQFVLVQFLLSTVLGKLFQLDNVREGIEKHGVCRSSIAPGTSYLLVETLDALWHVVMDDPSHVALVDAHTEGDGGTDHLNGVLLEQLLCLVTFSLVQSGMIDTRLDTVSLQELRHFLRILSAKTIDDATARWTRFDEIQDILFLFFCRVASLDVQAEVRTVEAGDKETGIV